MGTMNKKDWDAAFPETPDVVRHAVYSAFREGKKRDRRRRHFTQAAAIAATLVVMLGLGMLMKQAGLGTKRNVLTRTDSLPQVSASAQPGESGMTALPAATQEVTTAPTDIPTAAPTAQPTETVSPEPTVSVTTLPPEMENGSAVGMPESSVIYDDGETVYYPNLSGVQYYHASEEEAKKSLSEADADCVIIEGSRGMADSIGLWACPDCLFDPCQVYLREGDAVYHRNPHCAGGDLRGTHGCSLYEALLRGLTACAQCAAADEVFISPYQPTFYHGSTLCSSFASKGTKEFDTLAEDQALYNGMLPCAECLGADYSVLTASDWQRVVASGSLCAYQAGGYYHLDKDCAPEDAEWLLLGKAICSDLKPCPDCVQIYASSAADRKERAYDDVIGIYYTEGGTYYHTEPYCSGMRNAEDHALNLALASGKQPCPVCYPYDPTSQDSVTRYAMNVFSGCFGAEYPFERNVEQELTSADAGNGQGFCEFCYASPSTLLLDQTDGMYVNVYDHEVTLSMSLWDAQRMQSFIEQWKNTDLTSAYEQVFAQVSVGSNTTCRLYAVNLTAVLDESRYASALNECTFYFLMTNPSTNFRAAVEVNYSIANQRMTSMNWQYE